MEVSQGNKDEVEVSEQVKVPNVEGLSIKEAEKVVKGLGLQIGINNDSGELDTENTLILVQTPKEGVTINKGSKIYIEYK